MAKKDKEQAREGYAQRKNEEAQEQSPAQAEQGVGYRLYSPELIRDAASIPFSWSVGLPFDLQVTGVPASMNNTHVIPGMMVQYMYPSVGYASEPNAAVNIAATSIYSFIRHANSGGKNYDSPDLMLYLLAMSQVYSYIKFLKRLQGCVSLYSTFNRYLPRKLVQVQGANFDDLNDHGADFRYGINMLINKTASLAVPAIMNIFARHADMYANIYAEGESVKDQIYLQSPRGFWQYQETPVPGHLVMKNFFTPNSGAANSTGGLTVKQLLKFGNDLLDPIIQSQTFGLMSGDIAKAYGDNIIKVSLVGDEYTFTPIYTDLIALETMKNATVFGSSHGDVNSSITNLGVNQSSNVGYLTHMPTLQWDDEPTSAQSMANTLALNSLAAQRILTTIRTDPTPEYITEITRLLAVIDPVTTSKGSEGETLYKAPIYGGTEIVDSCWLFDSANSSLLTSVGIELKSWGVINATNDEDTTKLPQRYVATIRELANRTVFKFAPLTYYAQFGSSVETRDNGIFGDIDNYSLLSREVIKRIHDALIINDLFSPSIARF